MSDTGWLGREFCVLDVVIFSRPGGRACGGRVLVTRVVSPVSSRESWTVVGDDDRTVEPVELYLAYLTGVERSPNTVKAYAHDLKDWFEFLADRELDWRSGVFEDIGAFVVWLRTPGQAGRGGGGVLPSAAPAFRGLAVNRNVSALGSVYLPVARNALPGRDLM